MNKKGIVRQSLWIFSLIICILFLLTMFAWIDSQADSSGMIKRYLTRDLSLTLDTIQMSPGDVNISYTTKIPVWLEIKDGKVWVKDVESESFDWYTFTTGKIPTNFPKQVCYELDINKERDMISVEVENGV